VEKGKDYGWPTISYGIEYSGKPIGEGITQAPNMEQPIYYWDPVIAPSGMAFYTGSLFPEWRGSLFVGALAGKHLVRLTLDGRRVVGEERLLAERGARIRDVRQGPDGALYVLTDEKSGALWKLVPAERPNQSAQR
jgi:glucose/arabinose dehydrogenase